MTKSKSEKTWAKQIGLRKNTLDIIPTHPNNYTDSELFWKNLPQYRPTTLIGMLHYVCLVVITAQPGANASITPELLCHQEPFRNSSIPTMETALGCAGRVWRLETNSNHLDATVSSTGGLMKWCWHLKWKSDLIKIDTIWWCLMTFDGGRLGHGKARLGPKLCQHKSEQFQFPIPNLDFDWSHFRRHLSCQMQKRDLLLLMPLGTSHDPLSCIQVCIARVMSLCLNQVDGTDQ